MSEKLLELSSVVNVLSRTVGDLERQRQNNETRSMVLAALVRSIVRSMPEDRRAEIAANFDDAAKALLAAATNTAKQSLKNEIASAQRMLG
jgi:hypothetical protein